MTATIPGGYNAKNVAVVRDPQMPGLVTLAICGPRGGVQAAIWMTEHAAAALGAVLFDPDGGKP